MQLACILSVCAWKHVRACCPVNIPVCIHAYFESLVYLSKFSVSVFGEGLNNAQRDNKIEWMSVHLLLANFLCDLLHSTVPVTGGCDTFTHTSLIDASSVC